MYKTYSFWVKVVVLSGSLGFSMTGCKTGYQPEQVAQMGDDGSGIGTQAFHSGMGYQRAHLGYDDQWRMINKIQGGVDQVYYFRFASSNIQNQYRSSLKVQAAYLVQHPNMKVRIEGRADGRGSREYNIALGWRRVKQVTQYLKLHGVHNQQIKQVSYGKEDPSPAGDNPRVWRLNRRVNLNYETE